jgi:hypothetical protein
LRLRFADKINHDRSPVLRMAGKFLLLGDIDAVQ